VRTSANQNAKCHQNVPSFELKLTKQHQPQQNPPFIVIFYYIYNGRQTPASNLAKRRTTK